MLNATVNRYGHVGKCFEYNRPTKPMVGRTLTSFPHVPGQAQCQKRACIRSAWRPGSPSISLGHNGQGHSS